jgi:phosphohistidine swiveling domain-containing protein
MYVTKRSGFAMILAIFIVVLVALGGVMLLSKAALGSKFIGDNYLRAQAELLAQSATEFAVMRAQGFDHSTGNCLNQLNITVNDASGNPTYDANVSLQYSFRNPVVAGFNNACTLLEDNTSKDTMILMDVTVTTHTDANLSTEPIRVFERSWQKL